jgi:hypothetical protein
VRLVLFLAGLLASGAALGQQPELPALGAPEKKDEKKKDEKSYGIPAAEIFTFDLLLNRIDRRIYGEPYDVSAESIKRNLRGPWVIDSDPYKINQLLHPYQGSMYHGFARSAGLSFWESLGYTFGGSLLWEIAGETTPPSKNDQVASGIAGSFFGESLYRMANLILEKGEGPSLWRELSAAAVSPSTGFNRYAFGDRFSAIFNSHSPAYYSRVQVGAAGTIFRHEGDTSDIKRNEILADYLIDYGLPGKPGYHYDRPWDYFSFQVTASSASGIETLTTHGTLLAKEHEAGERYRGIWGLFGSYDYFAPQIFRVSSTALSLGTVGEARFGDVLALQGTVLAGVGYGGASNPHGGTDTDYHYGTIPQGLLGFRAIFGDASALDLTAREYFVSRIAGAGNGGRDNIARFDASFTVRVHKDHGLALKYLWSRRDATFETQPDVRTSQATLGLYYVYLGRQHFGATDWR